MSIILEALILQRLDQIQTTVNALTEKVRIMSETVNNLDTQITNLVNAVTAEEGVIASVETFIQGLSAQLAAAVAAAQASGVTPAQLQQVSDVVDRINAKKTELANAIAANPDPTPGPVDPTPPMGSFKLGSSKLGE